MPKQPETVDRFRIIAEVDAVELGPLFAQLAKMGLQNIGYELITDVVRFRSNPTKTAGNANDALMAKFLETHPTFRATDLKLAMIASGQTSVQSSTVHGICQRFVHRGILEALGEGNYKRTDVAAIAAPPQETRGPRPKPGERGIDLTRAFMVGKKFFNTTQLKNHFQENGKRPDSSHQCVFELVQRKELKNVGKGMYEVIMTVAQRKVRDKAAIEKKVAAMNNAHAKKKLNGTGDGAHA